MAANPSRGMFDGTVHEKARSTQFGFRYGERGTHGSRSIMLPDLRQLLASTAVDAAYEDEVLPGGAPKGLLVLTASWRFLRNTRHEQNGQAGGVAGSDRRGA